MPLQGCNAITPALEVVVFISSLYLHVLALGKPYHLLGCLCSILELPAILHLVGQGVLDLLEDGLYLSILGDVPSHMGILGRVIAPLVQHVVGIWLSHYGLACPVGSNHLIELTSQLTARTIHAVG